MSMLPYTARSLTAFAGIGASASAAARQQQKQLVMTPASFLLRRAYNSKAVQTASIAQRAMSTSSSNKDQTTARVSTPGVSPDEAMKMLNEQRSLRPTSPHLTIYEPQLTWVMSGLTRITGVACSGLFYVWAMSYLALPYTGVGQVLSSAHMVQYAAMAPFWLKTAIKAPLAFAFTYHSLNGIRHLFWDMGYGLSMKGVYQGGYLVMGLTALTTIGLCML